MIRYVHFLVRPLDSWKQPSLLIYSGVKVQVWNSAQQQSFSHDKDWFETLGSSGSLGAPEQWHSLHLVNHIWHHAHCQSASLFTINLFNYKFNAAAGASLREKPAFMCCHCLLLHYTGAIKSNTGFKLVRWWSLLSPLCYNRCFNAAFRPSWLWLTSALASVKLEILWVSSVLSDS